MSGRMTTVMTRMTLHGVLPDVGRVARPRSVPCGMAGAPSGYDRARCTMAISSSSSPPSPPPQFDGVRPGPKSLTFSRLIRVAGVTARTGPLPAPAYGERRPARNTALPATTPERTPSAGLGVLGACPRWVRSWQPAPGRGGGGSPAGHSR